MENLYDFYHQTLFNFVRSFYGWNGLCHHLKARTNVAWTNGYSNICHNLIITIYLSLKMVTSSTGGWLGGEIRLTSALV